MKDYLNFPPNFIEIVEALTREVQELSPLLITPLGLQQLKHERAARADVRTPRQEIAANESLKNTRFAAALTSDDGDLGQVEGGAAPKLSRYVLELVHYGNHRVPQRSRRGGRWRRR